MVRDLEALATFVEVVDRGGFSAAARRLGISKSVASRRVQRLESGLQVALLHRTTRGLTPTEAGRAFHERCRALLDGLDEACEAASGGAASVSGVVRLTASPAFACALVTPVIAALARAHPALAFDVLLDDRRFAATGEGVDLALRSGALEDSTLVARQLALVDGVVVASPAYLAAHPAPRAPADLAQHVCLDHGELSPHGLWRFHGEPPVRIERRIRVNAFDALCDLAVRGAGLAALPSFTAAGPIASGTLVPVMPQHRLVEHPLAVLFPRSHRLAPKVRLVVEALVAYAQGTPVAQWGRAPVTATRS